MTPRSRALPLLGGRNQAPLSKHQVQRVVETFLGLDPEMRNVRHEPGGTTRFRVVSADESDTGEEYGEIVFGPDIYPGSGVATANSLLTMRAAAAHELAHYHRWLNLTELKDDAAEHLDEAYTSLEAVQRFGRKLDVVETEQLVGDSLQRLALVQEDGIPPGAE